MVRLFWGFRSSHIGEEMLQKWANGLFYSSKKDRLHPPYKIRILLRTQKCLSVQNVLMGQNLIVTKEI